MRLNAIVCDLGILVALQVASLALCFARSDSLDIFQKSVTNINTFDHKSWCFRLESLTREVQQTPSSPKRELLRKRLVAFVHKRFTTNAHDEGLLWTRHACNITAWSNYVDVLPWPKCTVGRSALKSCPGLHSCVGNASYLPHVAIMMGSTSRSIANPSILNLPLFTRSFLSVAKTVECGFRYTVYVGYDAGDAFFDHAYGMRATKTWFQDNVRAKLDDQGIQIRLKMVRIDNVLKKPGPVFNAVATEAKKDAVDFYYRVNDDTLLITTSWASKLACALCSMGPPYGVVGPLATHRSDMLEHDFVHSTHMDIFKTYYAEDLVDWWMDDWISRVYGNARSLLLIDVKVSHGVI